MKKVRLLCLLALLFAVGSAFKTNKSVGSYYKDPSGNFHVRVPGGSCTTDPGNWCEFTYDGEETEPSEILEDKVNFRGVENEGFIYNPPPTN